MTTLQTNAQKLKYLLKVRENLNTMIDGSGNDYEQADALEKTYHSILRTLTILETTIRKEQLASGVTNEQLIAIADQARAKVNDISIIRISLKEIVFMIDGNAVRWVVKLTKTGKVRKNSFQCNSFTLH